MGDLAHFTKIRQERTNKNLRSERKRRGKKRKRTGSEENDGRMVLWDAVHPFDISSLADHNTLHTETAGRCMQV